MSEIKRQESSYNAGKLQVLEGLDAVRMRPGMYIGSTGSRGLHHLLWEIVDNAIDEAMGGFATEVTVTLHRDGSASVWDNGRGMPQEAISKITEAFYRVDKSRSRAQGGAGLGLALCRQIVELHGGKMEFESILGKGTSVKVTLNGGAV